MPKVSIIVPIYNVEKYLVQCLESIQAQTLKEIEILCINDGSTDGSLEVLRSFEAKDQRFKIVNKSNAGYGHTMNIGLSLACGEYVGIVESDDFISPHMFEKLYEKAKMFELDAIKSSFSYYWSIPEEKILPANIIPKSECDFVFSPVERQFVFHLMPSIWSGLYKNVFLKTNKIKFLETPGASFQDTSFAFKVWASARRAMLVEDGFLYYRQDNENSSINNKAKVFCICEEFDEIEKFVRNNSFLTSYLGKRLVRLKFGAYMWNLNRISTLFRREFLCKVSQEFRIAIKSKMIAKSDFTFNEYFKLNLAAYFPLLFLRLKELRSSEGLWKKFL